MHQNEAVDQQELTRSTKAAARAQRRTDRKQRQDARSPKPLLPKTKNQAIYVDLLNAGSSVFAVGGAGVGKAQPLDAAVRISGGWTTMGELFVGSSVVAQDGTACLVSGVYPQGLKQIYRIEFEDGRAVECCAEHLWEVHCANFRPREHRIISLAEIGRLLTISRYADRLSVPLIEPEYAADDIELPIPPYLMGALLGNGGFYAHGLVITTPDAFVINKITPMLPPGIECVPRNNLDYGLAKKGVRGSSTNALLDTTRKMGIDCKLSYQKFIPSIYFQASGRQRLELLQGLMDADGGVDGHSSTSYSSSSKQLASDVQRLLWSLGAIAKIENRQTYYTYRGIKKAGLPSYRVRIRVNDPTILFTLPRKLEKISANYQYAGRVRLRVKRIIPLGEKLAQCISIDHPRNLYVTDNFVATHNTYLAARIGARKLIDGDIDKIVVARVTVSKAKHSLGFLPGKVEAKMLPWLQPVIDGIRAEVSAATLEQWQQEGRFVIASFEHMRGRTFDRCYLMLDEAQNADFGDLRLFLTRTGEDTQVVVTGDLDQVDIPDSGLPSVLKLVERFRVPMSIVRFTNDDVVRSPLAKAFVKAFAGAVNLDKLPGFIDTERLSQAA